jgi:hypothetical protein
MRKISTSAAGTTSARRCAARCWFSNSPPQVQAVTGWAARPSAAPARAHPRRSRPDRAPPTLAITTILRLPSWRLICTGPVDAFEARQLAERNAPAARQRHRHLRQIIGRRVSRPSADEQRIAPFPVSGSVPMRSPSICARSWPTSASISSPARASAIGVRHHAQILHALVAHEEHILGPRYRTQHLGDLARLVIQVSMIRSEHADRQIAAHAENHFRHAHFDRLRERVGHAGKSRPAVRGCDG